MIPTLRYGKVRCQVCKEFYDIDQGHICPGASIQLDTAAADPTTIPDPDRAHPIGLTWIAPLLSRPIILGPSADHPDLRPALDLAAERFWAGVRHGERIAERKAAMEDAAFEFALSADPDRSPHLLLAMAEAADAWTEATNDYALELMR